jgi:hypothetical protein
MIYPHVRLQNGDNFIQGHVPYQIPSAKKPDPEAQWSAFLTPGEVREKNLLCAVPVAAAGCADQ